MLLELPGGDMAAELQQKAELLADLKKQFETAKAAFEQGLAAAKVAPPPIAIAPFPP